MATSLKGTEMVPLRQAVAASLKGTEGGTIETGLCIWVWQAGAGLVKQLRNLSFG